MERSVKGMIFLGLALLLLLFTQMTEYGSKLDHWITESLQVSDTEENVQIQSRYVQLADMLTDPGSQNNKPTTHQTHAKK